MKIEETISLMKSFFKYWELVCLCSYDKYERLSPARWHSRVKSLEHRMCTSSDSSLAINSGKTCFIVNAWASDDDSKSSKI